MNGSPAGHAVKQASVSGLTVQLLNAQRRYPSSPSFALCHASYSDSAGGLCMKVLGRGGVQHV